MTSPHWPDPAKQYAFKLILEGHSGASIAHRVNAAFPGLGKSRNAIIGIAYRNGLSLKGGNPGTGGARPKARKPRPRNTKPFVFSAKALSPAHAIIKDGLPIPDPKETDIPRVATVDLEAHHCRWPCLKDPREVSAFAPQFCGEPKEPSLPYCRAHVKRAYAPPQPRRGAPAAPAPAEPAKVLEAA